MSARLVQSRGRAARRRAHHGFTLTELIVVIAVMAIGASVVGYGVLDFGTSANACNSDARTVRAAEAQYYVQHQVYATQDQLVNAGLLAQSSTMHSVTLGDAGASYTLGELGSCIGSGSWAASPGATAASDPGITVLVTDESGVGVSGVTAYYQCETTCGSGGGAGFRSLAEVVAPWTLIATTDTTGVVRAPNVGSGQYKIRIDQYGNSQTFSGVSVNHGSLVYYSAYNVTSEIDTTDSAQPVQDDATLLVRKHGAAGYTTVGGLSAPSTSGTQVAARPVCGAALNSGGTAPIRIRRTQALIPGDWDFATQINGITTTSHVVLQGVQTLTYHLSALVVKVSDANGDPLCPATVTLTPNGQSALAPKLTDASGIAKWHTPAGTYSVTVRYAVSGNVHEIVVNNVTVASESVVINVDAKR